MNEDKPSSPEDALAGIRPGSSPDGNEARRHLDKVLQETRAGRTEEGSLPSPPPPSEPHHHPRRHSQR